MATWRVEPEPIMSILEVDNSGGCAIVRLNRPHVLNALNTALLDLLDAALDRIEAIDVRALILTGAGRAFCSGSDISGEERQAGSTQDFANAPIKRMHALILRLIDYPMPSIAAINGLAYGGGLELSLGCTFRTAAPGAKFGLPEIKLGLIPAYGGTQLLPRLIGPARALELMLTGESIAAEEALRIGLVNTVAEDPIAAAISLADRLVGSAGIAQRMIRRAVQHGVTLELPAALEMERAMAAEVAISAEAREGVARFLARKQQQRSNKYE
jgi:enoyl-CoA hydratase/carnithine racemase